MNSKKNIEFTRVEELVTFLKCNLKQEWFDDLNKPEGGTNLSRLLQNEYTPDTIARNESQELYIWRNVGYFYRMQHRWQDAIAIYESLYSHFLKFQLKNNSRIHKGMPLLWMSDCYSALNFKSLAKRFLMLTLIEDAITGKGSIDSVKTGSFFRLNWYFNLSEIEIRKYAKVSYECSKNEGCNYFFPEHILQELDKNWIIEIPISQEINTYTINTRYLQYLVDQLGESSGKILERIADYMLSCIPGCRTYRRKTSFSTDYDLVCSIEGADFDFRSEFGRYFVCECKDWKIPADFTTIAKFTRVLDSVKARFGIIFSKNGISGELSSTNASREQQKVFQDRNIIIIVIDETDLNSVCQNENFISILRQKYESVRLDLR